NGRSFVSPGSDTLLDLPKGTQVIPNRETESMLSGIPQYADGIGYSNPPLQNSEFAKLLALNNKSEPTNVTLERGSSDDETGYLKDLLSATLEQNQILTKLLKKDTDVILDSNSLVMKLEPKLTNQQERKKNRMRRR